MYTNQLIDVLQQDDCIKSTFRGVYSSDTVPDFENQKQLAFICNTKPSWSEGEHWCSVFRDNQGRDYFFDSFGRTPTEISKDFANSLRRKSFKNLICNPIQIQCISTESCGLFVIFFILCVCHGLDLKFVQNYFDPNDAMVNEIKIRYFIEKYFK